MPDPDTQPDAELLIIALRRLRVIPVRPGACTPAKRLTFLAELAKLGYAVDNPQEYSDSILRHHATVVTTLARMRGGDVNYVPLFQGFPDHVPEQGTYLLKRIVGYLENCLGGLESGRRLDSGFVVPVWLFDTEEFGADPITQLQDLHLHQMGAERQSERKVDQHREWIDLTFVDEESVGDRLQEYCRANLYSKSSIKESVRADVEYLLDHFGSEGLDFQQIVFKETRTLLSKYFWLRGDISNVDELTETPTDALRLMAALTDTDVSLATPIRFPRLTRPQRRFVMRVLEKSSNLEEDLRRYRGLWLSIARSIHAGEMAKTFPKASRGVDTLRNGKIVTFDARVERAIEARDIAKSVDLLRQRPGVMARRLHHLLEIAEPHPRRVLDAFREVSTEVALKNLLVMASHFRTIDESPYRAVINKNGRIRVLPNRQGRLRPETTARVVELLDGAIVQSIGRDKERWQGRGVWVDPRLRAYTVPLQQRKASEGVRTIGRGSRIPLDVGRVLRLFVYWKQAEQCTDLDLSLIQFDENMEYVGHVSYTNLESDGIVHSGDIQSAPHGAAEFIDVNLSSLRTTQRCRYIASQVYRYCGDPFGAMQCHGGWMIRDRVDSDYKSFDIATVQHKFDLTGNSGFAVPILVDLKQKQIIYVDLYVGRIDVYNRVERSATDIAMICRQASRMVTTRPNLYDLAQFHIRGRDAVSCDSPDEAEIIFGVEEGDYSAHNIAPCLAELL